MQANNKDFVSDAIQDKHITTPSQTALEQTSRQQNSNQSIPVTATIVRPTSTHYKNITIAQLKAMRRNSNLLSISLTVLGMVSGLAALSGTKYPLQNFCLMPDSVDIGNIEERDMGGIEDFKIEAISRRSERRLTRYANNHTKSVKLMQADRLDLGEFCRNGANIYTTHPDFLLTSNQPLPKSEFSFGAERHKIPARNRLDLNVIMPTNPGYLIYALFSSALATTGVLLYGASNKRYIELFPVIFEQHRTFTLESQLTATEDRENVILDTTERVEINRHATAEKVEFVKEEITNEYAGYRATDYSESQIAEIQQNALKQEHIQNLSFELQVAEIAKQIALAQLDTVKNTKEITKLQGKENKRLEGADDVKQQRIDRIAQVLKEHEDGWLYKVLEFRKPLWIIGGQGSGKSTIASCIILLRYFMFDYGLEFIVDAHAQVNRLEAWEPLIEIFGEDLKIVGDGNNYGAIANTFEGILKIWADRMPKFKRGEVGKTQMLVDEFSNLADMEECKEQAGMMAKKSLSDPRKAGYFCIFLSHFATQTGTGNKGGTSEARKTQTIQINRKSANGETPLPNVTVNGLPDAEGNLEEFNGTIPNWFRPEKIMKYFQDGLELF